MGAVCGVKEGHLLLPKKLLPLRKPYIHYAYTNYSKKKALLLIFLNHLVPPSLKKF